MKEILIDTVPHADQRYDTVGDWWTDVEGRWHVRVSELGDWRWELLVVVHELVEMALCKHAGIDQREIDAFDVAFEKRRPAGNVDEPGDDPAAPYHLQHCAATGVERILAALLGVRWAEYEMRVNAL